MSAKYLFQTICIVIAFSITSCAANIEQKKNENESKNTSLDKSDATIAHDIENCDYLIQKLIETSSYESITKDKKFSTLVDEINASLIRVKVSAINDDGNQPAIGWIELDLIKNEVRDVTIDPDAPIQIKFDVTIFNKIKEKCKGN